MSYSSALADAQRLKAMMAKHGVACSIELQAGRPWGGDAWYSRKFVIMNHDTVGPMSGKTPSLGVCKNGRGGAKPLPGPLCNGYGGRDFVYRILTMGLANHPGVGGPLTVGGFTIPKDSARVSAWGTEWEHDGVSAWPRGMAEFMGRSNAALVEFWAIPISRVVEHATWTARKIDRSPAYTRTGRTGQDEVRKYGGLIVAPPTTPPAPTRPAPLTPPPYRSIPVDGDWGPATWRATQRLVKVPQTGKVNAATLKALQRYLGMKGSAVSGVFSKDTRRHVQAFVKVPQDGVLGPVTIKAWQRHLNRALS